MKIPLFQKIFRKEENEFFEEKDDTPFFRKKSRRVPVLWLAVGVVLLLLSFGGGYCWGYHCSYHDGYEKGYFVGGDLGYQNGFEQGLTDGRDLSETDAENDSESETEDDTDVTSETASADGTATVYVVADGTKYHNEDCSYISDNSEITALTVTDAEEQGYTACKRCFGD